MATKTTEKAQNTAKQCSLCLSVSSSIQYFCCWRGLLDVAIEEHERSRRYYRCCFCVASSGTSIHQDTTSAPSYYIPTISFSLRFLKYNTLCSRSARAAERNNCCFFFLFFFFVRWTLQISLVNTESKQLCDRRAADYMAETQLLVNSTCPSRTLASLDRFYWLDDDERQHLQMEYTMVSVSLELLAEIHLERPGYLQILPADGAGSTAAAAAAYDQNLRDHDHDDTSWNFQAANCSTASKVNRCRQAKSRIIVVLWIAILHHAASSLILPRILIDCG